MNTLIAGVANNVIPQAIHFPAVSMILPFNPKMSSKNVISSSLSLALNKIEKDLHERFPDQLSTLVLQKLKTVLSKLDFSTHCSSIAMFVSPFFEKMLYLDFPVEKKIAVDDNFDIRDLVYCKKEAHEYLVLHLKEEECRLYLGSPGSFVRILSNTPGFAHIGPQVTPGGNTSYQPKNTDQKIEQYLRYNDKVLDVILKAYPLPLFVLGNATITGYFKGLTQHSASVMNYLEGMYENAGPEQINLLVQPLVADWRKVKERRLLNQLDEGAAAQKLVTGLNNVWQEAVTRGGHMLIFEKDHSYTMEGVGGNQVISDAFQSYNSFTCIKDKLDEAIDRVLEKGGSVEFVDKDVLEEYDHVALLIK